MHKNQIIAQVYAGLQPKTCVYEEIGRQSKRIGIYIDISPHKENNMQSQKHKYTNIYITTLASKNLHTHIHTQTNKHKHKQTHTHI